MSKIYPAVDLFQSRKCPVGAIARHPDHGLVRVIDADGFTRYIEAWVDEKATVIPVQVQELRGMNPRADLGLASD